MHILSNFATRLYEHTVFVIPIGGVTKNLAKDITNSAFIEFRNINCEFLFA
jgi:hypothetical protein